MKKIIFIAIIALATFASCSEKSHEFVQNEETTQSTGTEVHRWIVIEKGELVTRSISISVKKFYIVIENDVTGQQKQIDVTASEYDNFKIGSVYKTETVKVEEHDFRVTGFSYWGGLRIECSNTGYYFFQTIVEGYNDGFKVGDNYDVTPKRADVYHEDFNYWNVVDVQPSKSGDENIVMLKNTKDGRVIVPVGGMPGLDRSSVSVGDVIRVEYKVFDTDSWKRK